MITRRPWKEELAIIDRTMKAISGIMDPEELVEAYWGGIGELLPIEDYVSVSRRNVEPPHYLITRSSRFKEHLNPWTQRDRLPRLAGGLLGEIAYANQPVIIDNLPERLMPSDPAHFYLEGFQSLLGVPQYDNGEGLNVTMMLLKPGVEIDYAMLPMLHWQTALFGRGTQNLVLRNQLADALKAIHKELTVVGEIQRSLLPEQMPEIPGFEFAADYQTSARAGGDYYDFFPMESGRWGIFIADVSGHGTPAAVLMAITRALVHSHANPRVSPSSLLTYLNQQLTRSYTRAGTFVTAFCGVLDPGARTLTYSSAGHNPPRLARDGRVQSLEGASSLPLGIEEKQLYDQATVQLRPGDLVLLYTDGITEAMSPVSAGMGGAREGGRELYGTQRLDSVLARWGGDGSTAECISGVREGVAAFSAHAPPADDQTLIAIRCG